jgi:hypothetical protein
MGCPFTAMKASFVTAKPEPACPHLTPGHTYAANTPDYVSISRLPALVLPNALSNCF